MSKNIWDEDFKNIRTIDGSQYAGFEELVCQLALREENVPPDSTWKRFRGEGGDGGVEAIRVLANEEVWGYQSKYIFSLNKTQLDKSVKTALDVYPKLTRYKFFFPFLLL